MTSPIRSAGRLSPRAIRIVIGLLAGAVIGFAVGKVARSGVIDFSERTWSDKASLVIALMMVSVGLIISLVSLNRRAAGQMMDPESGRAATPAQSAFFRQQGFALLLAGVMMAAPVIALMVFDPLPAPISMALMMAIVAAFLVQTVYNLLVWRQADELMRQTISETGAICFWVLQGLLFLWAAAEKLSLAPALSAWDMMTIMMAFYLLVSSTMSVRRGLV